MTQVLASQGLVPLAAPVPSPPLYDLLAAATLVDPASDRWLGGVWTGGDVPGPAYTHDPCSSGTDRVKAGAGEIPDNVAGRFTVYLPGFCTAQGIGPDADFWTDKLKLVFQAHEGRAVERVLATGDGHSTLGPFLGDPNMETLGGGAVTALRALELLETEIGLNEGTGIIHAAPATATAWAASSLVTIARGQMRTQLGTVVAVGRGYIGVHPASTGAPASDQEWAFASGPIEILRDPEVLAVPGNYAEALDRSLNDVLFIAERPYAFNWIARQSDTDDDHTQAGVLVDLVP